MTRISKKKLKKDALDKIQCQFFKSITNLKPTKTGESFLSEFFTDTEKILFAKRLSVIMMLDANFSYYRINKTLRVSTSTTKRMHEKLLLGNYDSILKAFRTRKEKEIFWNGLEILIRSGMPPMGRGRWKYLYTQTSDLQKK